MYITDTKDILEAQSNNKDALEKIVEENSGLVWSITKRFIGRGYDKEELYQVGCIGLIKAIKRFDMTYDVKISTYAVPYILGEIKKFIRDDGPIKVSRSVKELVIKIKEIQRKFLNENGEEITISELAKKLGISKEEVVVALESVQPINSIDEEIYDEDSETRINKISSLINEEESVVNKIWITKVMEDLEENQRKIIYLRFFKEKTQMEVAKMLGISQVQVSRIEKKTLIQMRRSL